MGKLFGHLCSIQHLVPDIREQRREGITMDWDTIELNWEKYRNLAREKWHRIPHADFQSIGGSRERLIRAVEQAYDYSSEQARREVAHWISEASQVADAMAEMGAHSRSRAAAEIRALAGETSTRIEEGRQRFADLREQAGARGELALRQVRGQVRAHPVATLALSISVGMLLGHLMTRRR
jgi:ElaB/YqjD/DUF883 family membrane-anchored ribosome-binding protein